MTDAEVRERRGRRWRVSLLVLGVLVLLGFGFRRSFLTAAADYLEVGNAPAHADFLFLLMGDIHLRPTAAAEIYRKGFVPRIVMSRTAGSPATDLGVYPNETEAARALLLESGVPDSAIVVLAAIEGVASTTDEALELRSYLEANPADTILVLTSDYHTRRARWNLERQLDGTDAILRIVGVPDPRFSSRDWWRSEVGLLTYVEEYLKFAHNLVYR